MHWYQVLIEYEGTNFRGWQIQKKGSTIQKLVQSKISKILKEKINLIGAGRTDTGVHALEQSAHFDCKKKIIDHDKFIKSANFNKVINSFLGYILPPEKSIDIDLEEDWKLAEITYKGLNK